MLNKAEELEHLQSDYFVRMMLPEAEEKVSPYVVEEKRSLLKLLDSTKDISNRNFIVIGCGTLWYIDITYERVGTYIGVEPLADIFLASQIRFLLKKHKNVKIIPKKFGSFSRSELNNINSIFVFHFNIFSYMSDPLKNINKYIKKGDILYISSWSNTMTAKNIRKKYFHFINSNASQNEPKINPERISGICNLDLFPFSKLKFYKSHRRIKGEIVDILLIYT